MTKPLGVAIIAICSFLGAAVGALMGTHPLLALIRQQVQTSGASSGWAEIGAALVLFSFVFPILYALAGWGLWNLKNWGRVLTIVLAGIRRLRRRPIPQSVIIWGESCTGHYRCSPEAGLSKGSGFAIVQQDRSDREEADRPDSRRESTFVRWQAHLQPARPSGDDGGNRDRGMGQLDQ
jgi:hypothetical protein